MIPRKYLEFAKKFFELANKDLERANASMKSKDYSNAVFHAQQAIEKATKAMLETKLFYTSEHNVLPYLMREFQGEWKKEFDKIVEALDYLHGEWSLTRYPRIVNGRVVSPDEEYDEAHAKKAIKLVFAALSVIEKFLSEKNVL
jgi:HEPN domain-containing protein